MKPIATNPAPLSAEQLRVAQLYADLDERRQHELLKYAALLATTFPRRAKPALRIVSGGAS